MSETILPNGLTPENEQRRLQMIERTRLQSTIEADLRAIHPDKPAHWYENRAFRLLQIQAQSEREAELHAARLRQYGV